MLLLLPENEALHERHKLRRTISTAEVGPLKRSGDHPSNSQVQPPFPHSLSLHT